MNDYCKEKKKENFTNNESLFLKTYHEMHIQRFYFEKYRSRYLKQSQVINTIINIAPLVCITLFSLIPSLSQLWLVLVGIFSVLEAFSRYLPHNRKMKELLVCIQKIDMMIGEMQLLWDRYRLNLVDEGEFVPLSNLLAKRYKDEFSQGVSEIYKYKAKYHEYAIDEACKRVRDIALLNIKEFLKTIIGGN